eukprot:Rhum_TRINITY_DN13966_c3_g1::Rhum_TRINITY_DN13966_c3_g1_i1::g.66576::m.66576
MPVAPRGSTRHPPPRIPFQGYGPSDDYLPPHRPATPSRSVIAGGEWGGGGGSHPRGASGRDVSPDRPPPLPVPPPPQPPRRPQQQQQGTAPTSPPPLPSHTPGTLPGDRFVIPHHPLDPNSTAAAAVAASQAAGASYELQRQQQQQHPNLYQATPRQQPSQAPSHEYRTATAAQEQEWGEFRPASLPREEGTGVAYTDDLAAMAAEELRLALSQERAMHDELRDRFARMVAVTQTKLSEIRREFQEKEAENATLRAMLAERGGGAGTPGGLQQQQQQQQQVEPPHAYTYSPAPAATPGGTTPRGKRRTSSRRPRKAGLPPEARGWQSPPQSPHQQQQRFQQQQQQQHQQHPGMRRGAHITTPPHRRLQTGSRIELGSPQESRWQHYG